MEKLKIKLGSSVLRTYALRHEIEVYPSGKNKYDIILTNRDGTIQFVHYRNTDDKAETDRVKIEVGTKFPEQQLDITVLNTSDLDELVATVATWVASIEVGKKIPYRDSYGFLRLVRKPEKACYTLPAPKLNIDVGIRSNAIKSDVEFVSGFQMLVCSMVDLLDVTTFHGYRYPSDVSVKILADVSMKVLEEIESEFELLELSKTSFARFLDTFLGAIAVGKDFNPIPNDDDDDAPF